MDRGAFVIPHGNRKLAIALPDFPEGSREFTIAYLDIPKGSREFTDALPDVPEGNHKLTNALLNMLEANCKLTNTLPDVREGNREFTNALPELWEIAISLGQGILGGFRCVPSSTPVCRASDHPYPLSNMSTTSPSKFAGNQFLTATDGSYLLMSEILADTLPRASAATAGLPAFSLVMGNLASAASAWNGGETLIANAETALPGASLAFDDKMAALTRKPDADTSSVMETWDATIRSQVAYQGPIYVSLFPQGRETFTAGSREDQLDALRDCGLRLSAQTGKPVLVALGTTVTTFANTARALRTAQTNAKAALEAARLAQEPRRLAAAAALYALIGQGMVTWSTDPSRVDTLWNVNLLRRTTARRSPRTSNAEHSGAS